MFIAAILLTGLTLVVLLQVAVLFSEVVLGVIGRGRAAAPTGARPPLAVIVPAHNEASLISGTLRAIAPQLRHGDRMIVVADNCSDDTAAIAAAAGAEVLERRDPNHRGKGYALDYGVRHLDSAPPEVVIFIDADCCVFDGAIDRLSRECRRTGRPTQALYLMQAPKDASLMTRMAQFAWAIKNQVRPMGLHHLGLPCQLMGSGMAFSWSTLSSSSLATGHIVEDLKLGIQLARAGTAPQFCPQALVTSEFPQSNEGIRSQRTRWEHGHLSVILSDTPSLLLESLTHLDGPMLALALDLSVPPLALLSFATVLLWLASLLGHALTHAYYLLDLPTAAIVLLALSVLFSWACYGRGILSLGSLLSAPAYAVWKIPLYARFLVARQLHWVRSRRDRDTP